MKNKLQKSNLMLIGLQADYFGYGTTITIKPYGKIRIACLGELDHPIYTTRLQLAKQYENLTDQERQDLYEISLTKDYAPNETE